MLKIIKIYKGLQDIAVVENEKGGLQIFSMVEDPVMDSFEEQEIIAKLQTAFNIKMEK